MRYRDHTKIPVQAILDSAIDAIITIDENGIIKLCNEAVERLFGYTSAELIGQNVSVLMPTPHREDHDAHMQRYLSTGEKHVIGIGRETVGLRKDGKVIPLDLALSEVRLRDRVYFTGTLRDISDRKRAEEQLLQNQRLAALGEAMAGLAHESRNALQRAQACLEMLARRVRDQPQALEYIADIQEAQDDLHRLYEEVREFSAPIRINPEHCDLSEIPERTWDQLAARREGRTTTLRTIAGKTDCFCEVDPFAMRNAFRNILDNAIVAGGDPVCVEVEFQDAKLGLHNALRILIRDNGPGLGPEDLQRIFNAFFTTRTHGTGLGLAIVRRIIEAHSGTIAARNSSAGGAEFVITLPRRPS